MYHTLAASSTQRRTSLPPLLWLSPSRLDPYLWIRAIQDGNTTDYIKEGQGKDVIATSTGERFSFSYVIPGHPARLPGEV